MNIIQTERLVLREYTLKDISPLHSVLSDPLTLSYWPAPFTREQTESWINYNLNRYEQLGFGRWAVILKESGELIGDCGIIKAELDGSMEYDLGYIFHHPYWHKGYALEAAKACLEYAFNNLEIKRLCANMAFNHTASKKVAERLGMVKEKEYFNTRNRDLLTYLYAITR